MICSDNKFAKDIFDTVFGRESSAEYINSKYFVNKHYGNQVNSFANEKY